MATVIGINIPRTTHTGSYALPSSSPFFLHEIGYDRSTHRMDPYAGTREQHLSSVITYGEELALRKGFDDAWAHEHATRNTAEESARAPGSCVAALLAGRAHDMQAERHHPYHTQEVNSLRDRIESARNEPKYGASPLSPYTAARQSMKGRYLHSEHSAKDQALTQWQSKDYHV